MRIFDIILLAGFQQNAFLLTQKPQKYKFQKSSQTLMLKNRGFAKKNQQFYSQEKQQKNSFQKKTHLQLCPWVIRWST